MIKHYYTYDDLVVLLSCSKRTLERLIPKMNITKRTFGGGRKVLFLVLDVHAYLEFKKTISNVPPGKSRSSRSW